MTKTSIQRVNSGSLCKFSVLICCIAYSFFAGPGINGASAAAPTTEPAPGNGSWTLYSHDGREYVTIRNVAEFYKLQNVSRDPSKVLLISPACKLEGQSGSKEFLINGVKFVLSYDLWSHENQLYLSRIDLTKLVEPVLRPNRMRNIKAIRTIVLDPGHGGLDRGAISPYVDEKTLTLDICLRARALLIRQGYRVEMTRTTDQFVPLQERPVFANRFKDGLFVSLHFNAGSNIGSGIETYTLAPRFVPSTDPEGPQFSEAQLFRGNFEDPENMALATAMHAAMLNKLPMVDRGIKRARFWVLRECIIPAVLVEGGFISNFSEASKLVQLNFRQGMAEAIVLAISNYQKAISEAPTPGNQELASVDPNLMSPPSVVVPRNDGVKTELTSN